MWLRIGFIIVIITLSSGYGFCYNYFELWLAFTPIKLNYLKFMIQKATELGVTKFIPILTERTVVREINIERINKIIVEASEQSNRTRLPKLEKLIKFNDFIKVYKETDIVFGDLNTDSINIKIDVSKPLIGPEGDFSEIERNEIKKLKNIKSLKINNNILRTETAAISILSIISFNLLS